ncbi:hypothetical protein FA95DRAFT_737298 [Auriscalpium vulgare]|uniref:Uncharacterized protein n=1 Tax=Auriscalpium vulgare TaxID=40419 RepID=A0ACB8SBR8_9AGAM|nr:hypothetical protein FA95DRAFT_737298 [Auriscalpium vulgare]
MSKTTTQRTLTVSYDIHPPAGTPTPSASAVGVTASVLHQEVFDVPLGAEAEYEVYYAALRAAVAKARAETGEGLTAWRDAVGSREQGKEPAKNGGKEDGDEEEEEEEEDAEAAGGEVEGREKK